MGEETSLSSLKTGEYPATTLKLTDKDFDAAVARFPHLVVDCYTDWCQPCKVIAPVIAELAKTYVKRVVFGKLNVEESQETGMKFKVMGVPTLLFLKNGKLVDTVVGAMPKAKLDEKVKQFVGDGGAGTAAKPVKKVKKQP